MADTKALERGAQGERRVAEVLERLRPSLGFGLIHDVLLDFNGHTTQIDHVLIDKFGLLIIETKSYGAKLFGTSGDHNWTACYRDGNRRPLFNPLKQNDIHRTWLHRLLVQYQRGMPDKYVQSLIVFVRGEIDDLKLSEADQMRVASTDGLAEYVTTRYDLQPNEGQLGAEAQADLWEFLCTQNRSADAEVLAEHIARVQSAKAGESSRTRTPRPRGKSAAERNWERKQERQKDELLRGLVAMGVAAAVLVLLAVSSCASVLVHR